MGRSRIRYTLTRAALLVAGGLAALLMIEAALRVFYVTDRYQLREGNLNLLFQPAQGVMPGIEGASRFTTDRYGIRALPPYDDIPPAAYRILAIGGSTTETIYLDDRESWTFLLQEALGAGYWVGNIGRSGDTSATNFYALQRIVPQYDIDMVLIMAGINDLNPALSFPEQPPPAIVPSVLDTFYRAPHSDFYALVLVDFLKREIKDRYFVTNTLYTEDQAGAYYIQRRALWQASPPTLDALPPTFLAAVDAYRANLNRIVDEAERQGVELVFITQPAAWSVDMPPEFEQYLWLVQYGAREQHLARYQMPVMVEALKLYNLATLATCMVRRVRCIDLGALEGNTSLYYDDVHFNEAGAQHVALMLAEGLRQ